SPAVPREERLVLTPGEPPLLAPAARKEEELAPERRTPALRLPEPPAHGDAALLPSQVHPGELQDLTRRDVVVRVAQLGHDGSCAHHVDPRHGGESTSGGCDL